jgi:adenine/guanine phosphoribosyltransferase-like PRPP-binding protein
MTVIIPRTPWPADFPDVVVHHNLKTRNSNPAYAAGKSGDPVAAQRLIDELLTDKQYQAIAALVGARTPLVVPVAAVEGGGFNAIPDAMAQAVAARLNLSMAAYDIQQTNYVAHTKANGWHRLVTPAMFAGSIEKGKDYLLIDDHVGFGGTLANLRGYIEAHGGHVIGMTTLTETPGARKIALRPTTAFMLQKKHGEELNHFWRTVFGYTTDCLTDIEAGYLHRVESVAAVKTRMAQAAALARGGGLSPVNQPKP